MKNSSEVFSHLEVLINEHKQNEEVLKEMYTFFGSLFMVVVHNYNGRPTLKDLAPKDKVTKKIDTSIEKSNLGNEYQFFYSSLLDALGNDPKNQEEYKQLSKMVFAMKRQVAKKLNPLRQTP